MLTEVMEHFGLIRELRTAGFFETEHHRQLIKDVKNAVYGGRLIALAGIVGCGKTVLLTRLRQELAREDRVIVSKSLSVDKACTTIGLLIAALFYDLSPDKGPEDRETRGTTGARPSGLFRGVVESRSCSSSTKPTISMAAP